MPGRHPPEFRRRPVELARELDEDGNRRYPIAGLARDLKISESCLRKDSPGHHRHPPRGSGHPPVQPDGPDWLWVADITRAPHR
jgi:hypothetical protein